LHQWKGNEMKPVKSNEFYNNKEILKTEVNKLIDSNPIYNYEVTRTAKATEIVSIRVVIDMYQKMDAEKIIV